MQGPGVEGMLLTSQHFGILLNYSFLYHFTIVSKHFYIVVLFEKCYVFESQGSFAQTAFVLQGNDN